MHIAIVRKRVSLHKGGAENYVRFLAGELTARGHRLTVVAESIDRDLRQAVEFLPVRGSRWAWGSKAPAFARRVGEILRRRNFDIVLGLARTPLADIYRVTDRLHAHWMRVRYGGGWRGAAAAANPRHRGILRLERAAIESPNLRRIVAQSDLDRRLLTEYYNVPSHRIVTIKNGVDTAAFRPLRDSQLRTARDEMGLPSDGPHLVFAAAGQFADKGLRFVIRALALARCRRATLTVVGGGSPGEFSRLARKLRVERRVHFVGRQHPMRRYYAAADLFVLPTFYEPLPNVVLEALACGTPVLTSATSGAAELVRQGENGYIVSAAGAVDEIARAIDQHLALSRQQKQAMSALSRRSAERFSQQEHVERVIAVLEEVLHEKKSCRVFAQSTARQTSATRQLAAASPTASVAGKPLAFPAP